MELKNLLKTFACGLAIFTMSNVNALTGTVNASDGLYIRSDADSSSSEVAVVAYNTKLTIESSTPTPDKGSGCSDGWYKVTYNGKSGYACSTWISLNNTTSDAGTYYTTSGYQARVTDYTYNYIRKTRSTTATVLETLMYGENLIIKGEFPSGGGCSSKWYHVSYRNNQSGYICSNEVTLYKDAADTDFDENDTAYCNKLKESGFPESYCPYLVKLHNQHPTWEFEPHKTKLKWSNVVSGESNKNYFSIMFDEKSFRKSDAKKDGGAWYVAKDSVNAFYLDPRNFLYEDTIFMFESLKYNEKTSTKENIAAILSGTDLNKDTYIQYFLDAGKKYDVSAMHTASRVIQEGTADLSLHGTSGSTTLKYRKIDLNGYYNFYNIGAYQDSYTTNPIARGLAYACGALNGVGTFEKCGYFTAYGRPWDTRKKAIYGGTEWIGDEYISFGQHTIYFQKFNTSNTDIEGAANNYTHQYMTNVQAPIGEAMSTYASFRDNKQLDSLQFVFSIPVYNSMPSSYTTFPPVGDSVNTLSSLKINDVEIPNFDEDVISYVKYVPSTDTSVKISATPTSSASSVSGTGTIELTGDETILNVIVTSETNEDKTYSIKIIKTFDTEMTVDELINKIDVKTNENYIYITTPKTAVTSLVNNINKNSASAEVKILDKSAKTKSSGYLNTNDTITIKMISGEEKVFNIAVLGDANGDGVVDIVDLLRVQKHILKSSTLKETNFEAADTNLDSKVDILDLLRVRKYILKSIKSFK